ncbi:MAG: transcription antitermination factor NusB [Gammaproteobacteria bacterium RIFCSPHIGHO2_12_FULL_45_9]|nr:MAG: transcription antitermination factor NusB [Gammaproteobacteria bacterium RIFCSPHIGHO2_12_FULL_45_9]
MTQKQLKPNARHIARIWAMQALFKMPYVDSLSAAEVIPEFLAEESGYTPGGDVALFRELVQGVITHKEAVDGLLVGHVDRPLADLTPVELAVLRIAVFELCYRPSVPYRVVINEALELTKAFGATDGHRYVNGVLDVIAAEVRAVEVAARAVKK